VVWHVVIPQPELRTEPLGKFLLLVALGAIVYFLLRNYKRAIARQQDADRHSEPDASASGEDMVRCAQCGVHLPRSESYLSEGKLYCSEEHKRLGSGAR
jgi:uncharacterized protein